MKIGERQFRVAPMLAMDAIVLQHRVAKVLAPALKQLPDILALASSGDDGAKQRAEMQAFSMIAEIFAAAEPRAAAELLRDICEIAEVKRPSGAWEGVIFDADFSGGPRLAEAYRLAIAVLKEQFGELFAVARESGARARATIRA